MLFRSGGGFIGLEVAENLRHLGLDVTIVQRPKQLMNPFDSDMASFIHAEMRKHGLKLALGYSVEGFEEKNGGMDVLLKDREPIHADMVVLAIGVTPESTLAREAGLALGMKGSILVNDRMETSVPDIYAVGDAVQVKHYLTGHDALIALAGPANKQGRIAADNICGGDSRYLGSQGSSVIKVFDMTAATTGINETNARKSGLDVDTVILSPMSHAGYYPGGKVMTMKVVFEKGTYRLLGAQIVGYDGVDKRIDVLSTAIHAGMKATELKDLDLAYAPPYSSAKDPVNMAGFMIDNICGGDSRYPGSQGSSVIKVFDMTAATTGINETNARKAGLDVDTVILSPMSHAGYYPGGKVMTMKVVFEKGTYRLLGAQIVGYDGVDKRIDVLATAIHAGMKATELKDLDLAYAPPYSSAKDPVNMAGFMIDNISRGLKQWHLADADKLPRDGSVTLLDTRTTGEYSRGHIDGFKNIPVDELRERISEIEAGKKIYVICQSGLRSYIATRILEGYGFEAYNFAGGFRFYDAVMNDRALVEKAYSCGMDK